MKPPFFFLLPGGIALSIAFTQAASSGGNSDRNPNPETVRASELEHRITGAKTQEETLAALHDGWTNPPATYRPHTRWWWPGNAVTKEGIDWQLEQMKKQGFGGVEIMSFLKIYDKGNIEFGSPEFFDMVDHTVNKARELGMEVTPPLGPGWNHGHGWVPEQDRSKSLVISEQEIQGGKAQEFQLALPEEPAYAKRNKKELDAVVAVKLDAKGVPDCSQRVDLTKAVKGLTDFAAKPDITVKADLPEGKWKVMGFWTVFTGQKCAAEDYAPTSAIVDHFDKKAIRNYAEYMVGRYQKLFGKDFGQTVDSFFGDSFEMQQEFTYWSTGLFDRFQKEKGYDLRPYLPMLKYDGAPETAYIRYDVGSFLHKVGMEGIIGTMVDYTDEVGVQMRQQPHYRFATEIIEASGRLQRPETEFTRRSFEPNAWPHKVTTSGAQFYPSKDKRWVSAEAFTFLNEKYRTTMEQIKRATDMFLRDGITQFYNHGYFYSPEKELAPARDLIWMNRISHVNTWWPYYRGLADYQARTSFLERQGRAQADVLIYSPMPTVWSERTEYPVSELRDIPFGNLPKALVASGYDFDLVNDDLLQHHSEVKDGKLVINGFAYKVLILPRVLFLSPETLAVIQRFVKEGGTVFALNTLPDKSTGFVGHEEHDKKLRSMIQALFATDGGEKKVGEGMTWFLPACDGFDYLKRWSPGAKEWEATPPLTPAFAEFIKGLKSRLTPAFEIKGTPLSNGLTFRHTRIGPVDAWFVCNLQPTAEKTEIILNSKDHFPQIWNPLTGAIHAAPASRVTEDGRLALPVDLQPWESLFVLLTPKADPTLAPAPDFQQKASFPIEGSWAVEFNGLGGVKAQLDLPKLADWTTLPGLKDFSGTGLYTREVELPADFTEKDKTVFLDLGEVHEVAEVRINGTSAGAVWMQPYRINISGMLRPGKNKIQILVANLLWNYAASLTEPTPIPEELHEHYGTTWKQNYNGWDSLQAVKKNNKNDRRPSGLLGPVTLITN